MLQVIPTAELMHFDKGWWQALAHGRLEDMKSGDPGYLEWGPLLLCAEDRISAGGAIGMHQHKNVEIVTIVKQGTFVHEDDTGAVGSQTAGSVATTSAGSGIMHAERATDEGDVRLVQIWLEPRSQGGTPAWQHRLVRHDQELVCLASGSNHNALPINSDVNIFGGKLAAGTIVNHTALERSKSYLHVYEGEIVINGKLVQTAERVLISGPERLKISAITAADFVLLDFD